MSKNQAAQALLVATQHAEEKAREAKEVQKKAERFTQHKTDYETRLRLCSQIVTACLNTGVRPSTICIHQPKGEAGTHNKHNTSYDYFPHVETKIQGCLISIERKLTGHGWNRHYTNQLLVKVGDYTNRVVTYPQKKDGSFNLVKIAARVLSFQKAQDAREEAAMVRKALVTSNETLVKQLCTEFKLGKNGEDRVTAKIDNSYHDGRGHWHNHEFVAPAGRVYVKVGSPCVTKEQACILLKALQEVKAIEPKGKE